MGTTASTDRAAIKEVIPPWVYTVKIPPEYASDKLAGCSDGMTQVGPNTVARTRTGQFDTDGARWSRGFTSGKHTFEIVFPMAHRAMQASVGVVTEDAPLYAKGRCPLVGSNKFSWGICLRSRRSFHKNGIVKKYPLTQVYLPDKFYMYLDADSGLLQFGSDLDYYGTAVAGDNSAIGPPPPCVVPAAPQMMSPQIRKEPPPPPPPTVVSNTLPTVSEPVSMKKVAEELPQEPATPKEEEKAPEEKKPAASDPAEADKKPEPEADKKPEPEPEAKAEAEAEKTTAPATEESASPAPAAEAESSGEKESAEAAPSGGDA